VQSATLLFVHLHPAAWVTHPPKESYPQCSTFPSGLLLSASDESRRQLKEKEGSFKTQAARGEEMQGEWAGPPDTQLLCAPRQHERSEEGTAAGPDALP